MAAREGDDVMVVDMCRDKVPRARFASTVEPQPGSVMEMSPDGKTFIVSILRSKYILCLRTRTIN